MFLQFIKPELLALIVVLYVIGMGMKSSMWFPDRDIPFVLNVLGVTIVIIYLLSVAWPATPSDFFALVFTAIVQGVLLAGASVNANQLIKQGQKE